MKLNWKETAQNYKQDYLDDLKALIAIDSERDDQHASDEYPLGPGPAKALQQYLEFGKRDGFVVKNMDNLVGYIEYGQGDQTFGILAHADVMPAGQGWSTNPFEAVIKDDKIFGRGTSDDKGPGLAAYYGLKMLKDQGFEPKYKIRLIIGTDEESDWTGMKHYLDLQPVPDLGFSPDAEFPVINGEKGITSFVTKFNGHDQDEFDAEITLTSFQAGERDNAVPRDAYAIVQTDDNEQVATDFTEFLDHQPLSGDSILTDEGLKLHVIGKAAHGMAPELGVNAGTFLASFLSRYQLTGDGHNFVQFIAKDLHDDTRAHHIDLNYHSEKMGDLTMNVGIMKYDVKNGGLVNTNFRYPKGITSEQISDALKQVSKPYSGEVAQLNDEVPHYVDADDPIVKKLLNVYKEQTGDNDAKPEVVGGGTYGRIMKRGVAFGALFPGTPDTMHQVNEFQPINDLIKAMSIYGQSIFELTK